VNGVIHHDAKRGRADDRSRHSDLANPERPDPEGRSDRQDVGNEADETHRQAAQAEGNHQADQKRGIERA
jgi:hypothetical protein